MEDCKSGISLIDLAESGWLPVNSLTRDASLPADPGTLASCRHPLPLFVAYSRFTNSSDQCFTFPLLELGHNARAISNNSNL
jgi:hypothetical protein